MLWVRLDDNAPEASVLLEEESLGEFDAIEPAELESDATADLVMGTQHAAVERAAGD